MMYVRSIAMERAPPRDRKAVGGANATAEATMVAKRIAKKDFMVPADWNDDCDEGD
jgi:hypothetical protein